MTGDTNRSDRSSESSRTEREHAGRSLIRPQQSENSRAAGATEYSTNRKDTFDFRSPSVGSFDTHNLSSSSRSWSTNTDAFSKIHPETPRTYARMERNNTSSPRDVEKEVKKKVKAALWNQDLSISNDRSGVRSNEIGDQRSKTKRVPLEVYVEKDGHRLSNKDGKKEKVR